MAMARAAPVHIHGLRRYRRAGVKTTPAMTPNTSSPMVYLVIMPKPMAAPMGSHHRGSSEVIRRMTNQATTGHQSRSNEV